MGDQAEVAYWNFDARHKGYGEWAQAPQSERDAFKAEYRAAVAATEANNRANGTVWFFAIVGVMLLAAYALDWLVFFVKFFMGVA